MRLTLAAVALLASLAARAECVTPRAFVLPRPGTPLPPNPTLYFFVPPQAKAGPEVVSSIHALTESGVVLPITKKRLAGGGELQVWRFDIRVAEGARIHLEPFVGEDVPWPIIKAGPVEEALVVSRGKDTFSRFSESLRVLDTTLSAPAFRIEFAEDEVALRAGEGESVVVEGVEDGFMTWPAKPRPMPRAVRLGHHRCWGPNLEWKWPQLAVRVTALLADGTERKSETISVLPAPQPLGSMR